MKRILNAYGAKFRALLVRTGARRVERGMQWYFRRAEALQAGGLSCSQALDVAYHEARRRLLRVASIPGAADKPEPVVFVCDVGLGGLARWLRAAGYMAYWREGVDDPELIEEARERSAILLTTDSGMMERRLLRDGELPALWVSPGLNKMQQLKSVLRELQLPRLEPRCMDCGGELERAEKKAMAARIPPKTFRWRDDFFVCRDCGKLFWHGTHWRRIDQRLQESTDETGKEIADCGLTPPR